MALSDNSENVKSRLVLENITKEYAANKGDSVLAVNDVSFEVYDNEVCALLGPSGCGKSTLLQIMAGLIHQTSGRLMLDGKEIQGPGRDRGMVFQSYTSFPWLSVYENVVYGMKLNKVPLNERKQRADYFLERVHMTKFRDVYPVQLSGGMKQRVAIARMLANEPEISLMDEPFGALDAETRWHMQELLLDIIGETKMTVVIVTHDIQEALFLADRIIFLSAHPGQLKETLVMDFKNQRRITSKEELIELPGYAELERKITRMMREQTLDDRN